MLIKIGDRGVNLALVSNYTINPNGSTVVLYTTSGTPVVIESEALAWVLSTPGIVPALDANKAFGDRILIEAQLAKQKAEQDAQRLGVPAPPPNEPQPIISDAIAQALAADPTLLAGAEQQLADLDDVLGGDNSGIDPGMLQKARMRRNEIAKTISAARGKRNQ